MSKIEDHYPDHERFYLMVANGKIFKRPTVVHTVLGSCVTVTFFCRAKKIGAIFHAILPVMPKKEKNKPGRNQYKYVDTSIRHILRSLHSIGVKDAQIEAKVFGGAQAIFKGNLKPGPNNIRVAFEVLTKHKIKILASDVGGDKGRNLAFITDTGEVFVKTHKTNMVDALHGTSRLSGNGNGRGPHL